LVQELASSLIKKLQEKNLTLAVAESLTGGLVAASLTEIPGASKVFKGSITAYSDEIKQNVLEVNEETILKFTSISEQVALEMAINVRTIMKSDIGISTTGVAGPEKSAGFAPGLVFVAISIGDHNMCQKLEITGDRSKIRNQTVHEILQLTLSRLV
jgi:nicotinamide-nucleotide amidase